jgi:hypothetical protein
MKSLLAAMTIVAASAAGVAAEPSCRQDGDAGKSLCVAGVLYRCACRQLASATVCSWDNAASACSALTSSEGEARPSVVGGIGAPRRD